MSRRTREVGFATERIVVSLRRYERTRALVDGGPSLAHEIVREVKDELGAEALKVLDEPREELVMVQFRSAHSSMIRCPICAPEALESDRVM